MQASVCEQHDASRQSPQVSAVKASHPPGHPVPEPVLALVPLVALFPLVALGPSVVTTADGPLPPSPLPAPPRPSLSPWLPAAHPTHIEAMATTAIDCTTIPSADVLVPATIWFDRELTCLINESLHPPASDDAGPGSRFSCVALATMVSCPGTTAASSAQLHGVPPRTGPAPSLEEPIAIAVPATPLPLSP